MSREDLLRSLQRSGASPEVVAAFAAVPRERFVPAALSERAWDDCALPLATGSTISQPAMVAIVLEELGLQPGLRVLEVGSGSGYLLALLAALGCEAVGVEIDPALAKQSIAALKTLRSDTQGSVDSEAPGPVSGAPKATVVYGDATAVDLGGPYDRVVFSASLDQVPGWVMQLLTPEGFALAPMGRFTQELERFFSDGRRERTGRLCRFVPFQES